MPEPHATRRQFLVVASAAALLAVPWPTLAMPDAMKAAIRDVVKGAVVRVGKVKFDVPPLVENGNTVPVTVSVTSPMTDADHVVSIHIFNEKNPQPNVGNFYVGPRAGRGQVATRIRLADTQTLTAIAKLSDGSFWSATADVVVTLAACTEEAS
ncbi:MAG: sulfur oxidation protein SoxY [Tardiphaga sp.]|uniref:SoxY-related AACIE arm protein n=1 Tax=Tardiphaga sp. TaxID=1926292 RepID=UPI002607A303|nr:SoxY-related AACIE arm protein [Tardiphaga sp.]MDB5500169.1 sulfur oxidation protein SoxY [Tardiphaga sp.]